jgi:signal transduction histidine kinase/ligand-binding sensor domain-containing protein/DNA-binding response OmpR family regulator
MQKQLSVFLMTIILITVSMIGYSGDYFFERLNVPVSHSNVITINQDKQGFMWFGTRNGLNRYDGVNMVAFHHHSFDSTSLINNLVNSIEVGSDSLLWIGTYDGLSLFDPGQFKFGDINHFFELNNKPVFGNVLSIDTGNDGEVWVGTLSNGIYLFDTKQGKSISFRSDKNSGGLCSDLINVVKFDSKGRLWAGTRYGLSLIEKNGAQVSNYFFNPNDDQSLTDNYITSIIEDKSGAIWIATTNMGLQKVKEEKGLIRFERVNFFERYYSYNPGFSILSMLCDREGNIWIGTENGGLYVIDHKTQQITRYMNDPFNAKSLAGNSIYTIFQSKDGIVWIGTYNQGVCYYDPNKIKFEHYFQNPTESNFLNCNIIKCISYKEKELIIGTDGGGLTIADLNSKKSVHFTKKTGSNSVSSNTIMCMLPDGQEIWLGTWDAGLNLFDTRNKTFKHYTKFYSQYDNFDVEHVTALCKDKRGKIWVATFGFGLNYYSPSDDKIVHFSGRDAGNSVFDNENIFCMIETSSGDLLMGTMDGLYRIKNANNGPSVTRYRYQPSDSLSLSNNLVVSLFEDTKKQIWVGTIGGGLNLFDMKAETFRRFSEKDGLPENSIRGIIDDKHHQIWISTNLGIARMNPDNYKIKAYRCKTLQDMGEFLFSSETIDADGFIYFGGSNGFIRFHPDSIRENQNIPSVYFSDFRLFNKSVQVGNKKSLLTKHISSTESVVLDHNQSVISIDFVALNYTEPGQNQYAYYLDGFEPDWNYSGQNNTATYTNLDPGKYVFKVKASNNDGIWNPLPTTLVIQVRAPLWATWWAFTVYIILLSSVFYLILRFYRKRAIEKEQLRAERIQNQNLQELKDRKLQFFTNISHEIRTPLSLIINPLEEVLQHHDLGEATRRKIRYAGENSKFLLKLVNQLLDFRKLDNSKMDLILSKVRINELISQIIELHRLRAEEKNIELVFEPLNTENLFFVDIDKIEKIIHNLLSNAVKFSPNNTLIFIRVIENKVSDILSIEVIDHGPGLDSDQIPLIFERFYQGKSAVNKGGTGIGLALCKELSEIHQGKIEVESTKGEGSCFRLVIPATIETYNGMENVNIENNNMDISFSLEPSVSSQVENEGIQLKNIKYTLVIVEDDPQICSYLVEEFSKYYKTYSAENGKEALKLIIKKLPDIIISDIIMPEMDGLELCRRIKGNIETSHIPIIILTAKIEMEHQIDGLETGADAYVQKPFNLRYLKVLVKNILEKRSNMFRAFSQNNIIIPSEFSTNKMDEEFLQKVIHYIEANIENTDLSVDMLAQNMNLSRSQVYRKIKALTDFTANEFIRQIRLKKSLKLLSEGNMNISEIAYSVGFSSQSYFTRSFKEYYGKSPSEMKSQSN